MTDDGESHSVPVNERALVFLCGGNQLVGVLHDASNNEGIGVLIVVGGPQTRVGSHRQFVQLARTLAANGIPTLRFDYRGMGDSDGPVSGFERISDDIQAAVEVLLQKSGVERVVLWGLCDAALAITSYANTDERVRGLVLLNPWVRTSAGEARTYMRVHYLRRLFSREFWSKIVRGEMSVLESVSDFFGTFRRAFRLGESPHEKQDRKGSEGLLPLPDRMINCVERFSGAVLLVMSGNDITAQEFHRSVEMSPVWRRVLDRGSVTRRELVEADHTFSSRVWSRQVEAWTVEWVKML